MLFIAILAFGSLFTGYYLNVSTLHDAFLETEKRKNHQINSNIQSLIKGELSRLGAVSRLLANSSHTLDAHLFTQAGKFRIAGNHQIIQLRKDLDFGIFEITDAKGILLFSSEPDQIKGRPFTLWGIDEALEGKPCISASKTENGWAVRSFVPVMKDKAQQGVIILGFPINRSFTDKIALATGTQISFATIGGVIASTRPEHPEYKVDLMDSKSWVHLAEGKTPIFIEHPGHEKASFYAAHRVVDETFCVVVETDIRQARALLKRKNKELLMVSVGEFILVVLFGYLIILILVKPLKALGNRAMEMAVAFSGNKKPPDPGKNEISGLVQSFNIMSDAVNSSVAETRKYQKFLAESEEQYRTLFETSGTGILLFSNSGILTDINPAGCTLYRLGKKEIVGKKAPELLGQNAQIRFRDPVEKKDDSGDYTGEGQVIREDGTLMEIKIDARPARFHKDNFVLVTINDITQQKKMSREKARFEERANRLKKMEALGLMAGGVAHDLNNILSGLVGYPDLILMDLPKDSPLRAPVLAIQQSGMRSAAIVQDLLTLARRGVSATQVSNLNTIVKEHMNSPEYKKLKKRYPGIRFISDLAPDLLNIFVSPVHLTKALMNLVTNSTEAVGQNGKIIISTRNQYIDMPLKGYDEVQEGDYAVLTVADNGAGISPDDMDRIFEPFYTRKVMGRSGTGLGMSVVWGTVKDHKGYINIKSEKNTGTIVELFFPATRKLMKNDKIQGLTQDLHGNSQTILVIDDIRAQRELASKMLSRLGYTVTTVPSGEAAVKYLETKTADLLVLDMIMEPGIDGLETYKRILNRHQHQKAVIASGFSESRRVKKAQDLGAGQYIQKPYTLYDLGRAVKDALERG